MKLIIHTDGGVTENHADDPGPAVAAFVVFDEFYNYFGSASCVFTGTNNDAEYLAILLALRTLFVGEGNCSLDGVVSLIVRSDSKLVVEQINGRWKIRHGRMRKHHLAVTEFLALVQAKIPSVTIEFVPRSRNQAADFLCRHAKVHGPKTDFLSAIPESI